MLSILYSQISSPLRLVTLKKGPVKQRPAIFLVLTKSVELLSFSRCNGKTNISIRLVLPHMCVSLYTSLTLYIADGYTCTSFWLLGLSQLRTAQ